MTSPPRASPLLDSATASAKGKEKAMDSLTPPRPHSRASLNAGSSSDSDSDSDSDSESDSSTSANFSDDDDTTSPEYLAMLLQKARQNAAAAAASATPAAPPPDGGEEDVITIASDIQPPLPPLDPGALPAPHFTASGLADPAAARALAAAAASSAPAPPAPPPSTLTKKQRKALKAQTAGPGWFDLPAPPEGDRARLARELEALRLRRQLDPKRFYRRDEDEARGGLPPYFAIGTIVNDGPPGSSSAAGAARKRTFVDELVDDAEARRYAKRKFAELQGVRGARGRNTLAAKVRRPKW